MVPLRGHHSCFFYDGPRSKIREGDLEDIWKKYAIHPSVGMRSPSKFERAPGGGAILGDFHGFSVGVHEILYSNYFSPQVNKAGFYHLCSRDGTPFVEESSRGIRGNYPFGDGWNNRYAFVKIQEPFGYPTSWRTVVVSRPVSFAGEEIAKLIMGVPRRFLWVNFLVSKEALRHRCISL
ncbi:hypothetical protein F2Q68_00044286 [Brassica cretica]|uniref:Uncharacterized protein n=1 Tax=Brassica cretica TaxID=69181 RepID=A0A8S9LJZ0_BRACR|nr:hypothetical protein F2Q68_00044286 [Brassica cretica]